MTPAVAYKTILQRWMALWHTLAGGTQDAPTVPYAIDNRKLTAAPPFAQVSIVSLGSDQATMGRPGHRRFERSGFVDVRLFGARDRGRGELDTLAGYVTTIYEALDLGGLRTYATSVTEVRNDREFPDLWCLLCRTGFEYHERR